MELIEYVKLATELGGEIGQRIMELVNIIEDQNQVIAEKKLPNLIGSKQVAELLEIDPRNMHHKRKTKNFPQPVVETKSGPLWIEQAIVQYKQASPDWRRRGK